MNLKKLTPISFQIAVFAIIMLLSANKANAQAQTTVISTNGYYVNITLDVVNIIAPNSCTWGYNFNTRISYNITFGGSNIPSSLYTLQTTLACGTYNNFLSLPTNGGVGQRVTHSNPWNPNSNCATATPASLNCNTFTLVIDGPGISNRTIVMNRTTALPVELIDFAAKPEPLGVKINWSTVSEINNDHFTLERSTDGINWVNIAKVMASENQASVNAYSVLDKNAAIGLNYYRLTQFDRNGTSTVYNSILAANNTAEIAMDVYPNPASTQFALRGENIEVANIHIVDAMGKTLELENRFENGELIYNTETLINGIYFVHVEIANVSKTYTISVSK